MAFFNSPKSTHLASLEAEVTRLTALVSARNLEREAVAKEQELLAAVAKLRSELGI